MVLVESSPFAAQGTDLFKVFKLITNWYFPAFRALIRLNQGVVQNTYEISLNSNYIFYLWWDSENQLLETHSWWCQKSISPTVSKLQTKKWNTFTVEQRRYSNTRIRTYHVNEKLISKEKTGNSKNLKWSKTSGTFVFGPWFIDDTTDTPEYHTQIRNLTISTF